MALAASIKGARISLAKLSNPSKAALTSDARLASPRDNNFSRKSIISLIFDLYAANHSIS